MKDLDIKFKKAFEIASGMKEKLPPDVMLQFYAYYKQATVDTPFYSPSGASAGASESASACSSDTFCSAT